MVFTALHEMPARSYENGVCLSYSLCRSSVGFVTKRKKVVPTFLHRMKNHLPYFCDKKNGWWGDPFYLKFWVKLTLLERKRRLSVDIRS